MARIHQQTLKTHQQRTHQQKTHQLKTQQQKTHQVSAAARLLVQTSPGLVTGQMWLMGQCKVFVTRSHDHCSVTGMSHTSARSTRSSKIIMVLC